jgi:hypothetical protein
MNNRNISILGIIGCVFILIGIFLPYLKVDLIFLNYSVSYIDGDGKIVLFAAVIALVLIVLNKGMFTLIPIGVATFVLTYDLLNFINKENLEKYGSYIKVGTGVYFMYIGFALTIIYTFLYSKVKEKQIN